MAPLTGLPPCVISPLNFLPGVAALGKKEKKKKQLPPLAFVLIISFSPSFEARLGVGDFNGAEAEALVSASGCCILHQSIPWLRRGPGQAAPHREVTGVTDSLSSPWGF